MRQDSRAQRFPNPEHASLFSKVFDVNRPEEASWFDPVLLRDNPVFVDPFLLDLTNEPEFRGASREVFEHFKLNRTDFGGDSIALKEDGVHDRYDRPPKLSSLSA
jgi:hypothetical protein